MSQQLFKKLEGVQAQFSAVYLTLKGEIKDVDNSEALQEFKNAGKDLDDIIFQLQINPTWQLIETLAEMERAQGLYHLFCPDMINPTLNPLGVVEGFYKRGKPSEDGGAELEGQWWGAWFDSDKECWESKPVKPTHFSRFTNPETN